MTLFALLLILLSPASAAAGAACGTKVMYVAAHEDDTLIFQNPDLLRDIQRGRCVRTVFTTAGDPGLGEAYWRSREAGAEAAYAEMAGVADAWTETETVADGQPLTTATLDAEPQISIVYMRLPDGAPDGKGFPLYDNESLVKLWRGGNPGHGGPTIGEITSVDGVSTYTYGELIEALRQLIVSFQPDRIATQNFAEHLFEGDHPDHTATAYFAKLAQEGYPRAHRLLAYQGYQSADQPANVGDAELDEKTAAFYAYGLHDVEACYDEASCSSMIYSAWLQRQYVTATVTRGVLADAGDPREAAADASVTLDGSASDAEGGGPLGYEWRQTKGPPVELSGADTAEPSFVTPGHPTLLGFSLVVSSGSLESEPDTVTVRVPSDDPRPVAIAGPGEEVDSGAAVGLSGSESYDPNSLPLEYAWVQTGGPPVTLAAAKTPEASFVAPAGPATLTFSLTVADGERTSVPATQSVTVRPAAPPDRDPSPGDAGSPPGAPGAAPAGAASTTPPGQPSPEPVARLDRALVRLPAAKPSRRTVKVIGDGASALRCAGRLPAGVRCEAAGGIVVLRSTGAARKPGTYRLRILVADAGRVVRLPLTVRLGGPR